MPNSFNQAPSKTVVPKPRDNIDDPMVPLEGNLYGHPLAALLWERRLENNCCKNIVRSTQHFKSAYVDAFFLKKKKKSAGLKDCLVPTWSNVVKIEEN